MLKKSLVLISPPFGGKDSVSFDSDGDGKLDVLEDDKNDGASFINQGNRTFLRHFR